MVAKMDSKSSDKPKQKPKHRKGLWSPEEDQRLRNYILKHGHGCWSSVPVNAGLQRNGKSCRLRWINYLRPGLKRGLFSVHEEETIMTLHHLLGNKWSQIAQHLPGRTDNEIKNYWHSYLKKRIIKSQAFETQISKTDQSVSSNSDNNTELPSSESSENMEKSSADNTDQSVHRMSTEYSLKEVNEQSSSSLPKLMFAEWLSLDSFANVNDQSVVHRSNNVFNHNPIYHENNLINECLLNGTTFGDMFGPFKFEEQSIGSEDQFVNFISGEDLCIDFDINNEMMYL